MAETTAEKTTVPRLVVWRRKVMLAGVALAAQAVNYRIHAALPGLLGAAMVACGIGGLAGAAFGPLYGPWAGVLAGGVFLLRVDSRIGGA